MLNALLALGAGAVLPFAFAPYGLWPLAVPPLALLFALLRDRTPGHAAWLGWCFGLGMFGHGVSWVQVSIHKFGLPLYTFSVSMTVLFVAFIAGFTALTAWAIARLQRGHSLAAAPVYLFLMPAVWTLGEWMRGWLFSGFPWLLVGYSQTDSPFAGYAPLVGALGTGFAVAMTAGGCALAAASRRLPGVLLALAVPLAGWLLGTLAWTQPEEPGTRRVALVQGAVPQAVKWLSEYREPTLALYESLSAPHWGSDVVLWPESAVPAFPDEIPDTLQRLQAAALARDTALLIGIPTGDRHAGRYFNSIVLLDGDRPRYDKHHLVPFGEYLPFDRWVRPVLNFLAIPMSAFSPGDARQPPLPFNGMRFGASICYEDAYAGEVIKPLPNANLLVNVSDDAWFGDSIAPHQHLQIARMRALETGRYLLRATNTGISAIIDARGKVIARSPQFKPFVLTGEVRLHAGATPFVRGGQWPLVIALTMGVLFLRRRRA